MTGVEEALVSQLLERAGNMLSALFVGKDIELRKVIRRAIAAAANDTALPVGVDGEWVASALLESEASGPGAPAVIAGATGDGSLDLEAATFAARLSGLVHDDLVEDLKRQGIDVHRVIERFGPRLIEAVRAHATAQDSVLQSLATRMESDTVFAAIDNVAASLGINRDDITTTLQKMAHESMRRILKRFDSLSVDDAHVLAKMTAAIELVPIPDIPAEGLVGLVAEAGTGKSTIAERIHLSSIKRALADDETVLPLFVDSGELTGPIEREIERQWASVPDLITRGVELIVDGLDETGLARGRKLVVELRSLAADPHSPVRRAIVALRPLDFGVREDELRVIEDLSEEEASDIVSTISGRPSYLVASTPAIAEAVRRPFFAIAVGAIAKQTGSPMFATQSRILGEVARIAVGDDGWGGSADVLARAGAAAVDAHHGSVPLARVAATHQEREILRTSRVVMVDAADRVRFPLALIAEWFASEYILTHTAVVSELVEDPDRLELWRYPVLLAIEAREAHSIESLLVEIATKAPAMAGWLLSRPDPHRQALLGFANGVEVTRERGELATEFRTAFGSLGRGIAPASSRFSMLERGRPNPLWLETSGTNCYYAWGRAVPDRPDIVQDRPDFANAGFGEWFSQCGSAMSEHPAWTWRHAQEQLRKEFARLRKRGDLFEGLPVYEKEQRWAVAAEMIGKRGSRNPGPISTEQLEAVVQRWDVIRRDHGLEDAREDARMRTLRATVEDLRRASLDELEAPWPAPDNMGALSGGAIGVWDLWTPEGMVTRLRAITDAALDLYNGVVNRELPQLARSLYTSRAMSGRFVGYRDRGDASGSYQGQPRTAWWFVKDGLDPAINWELVENVDEKAERAWESGQVSRLTNGEPAGLFTLRPATIFAMSLLASDLQEWGWDQPGSVPDN